MPAIEIPDPGTAPPDPADPSFAWQTQGAEDLHALNFPDNVEALLRAYGSEVLDARAEWLGGGSDRAEAMARIEAGAERLNRIFMGEEPEYRIQPWNTPAQLGDYLLQEYGLTCPPGETVKNAALSFAYHLVRVVGYGADGLWPRALVLEMLKRAVTVFRDALMGVPVTAPQATGEDPDPLGVKFLIPGGRS